MYKMMTYYQQLSMEIDKLKAEGKLVSIKHLPSTVNRPRNAVFRWSITQWKLTKQIYV